MDSAGLIPIGGFEERVIATVDGLALYARDYPALAPVTGLPVICLHGLTRNARDFEVVAPRIAALGRRVIAPDMRGRGRSANDPDPAHYVPAVYAQDVIALMDALGVARAAFVGVSMGGIITMVIAALAPDRVAASVLDDVGHKLPRAGLQRIGAYVGRAQPLASWEAAAEAARAINGLAYPERDQDGAFWAVLARRLFRQREDGQVEADYDPHIALAFADADEPSDADLTPVFQALTPKPILLVRGALSDILLPEGVAEMRAIKPDLAVAEVPDVGHAPTLEEPEAWDALLSFLARVD